MLRIIAGKFRGKKILSPKTKFVRPTSDRSKEMIFNTLHSIFKNEELHMEDTTVLDTFCGTGSLGIECLSRGAKKVFFVDNSKTSISLTKKNLDTLNIKNSYQILKIDLMKKLKKEKEINLFFMDPPYKKSILNSSLENLIKSGWLKRNAIGVVESEKSFKIKIIDKIHVIKEKIIGDSKFLFTQLY